MTSSLNKRSRAAGFTLLEVMLAGAVFLLVMGAAAQALVSYYVALDVQNQRNTAIQNCRAVLVDMRRVRDTAPADFPEAILDNWPDGQVVEGLRHLPGEVMSVDYADPTANPLDVTVTCQWNDLRGRGVRVSVSSLLTDR